MSCVGTSLVSTVGLRHRPGDLHPGGQVDVGTSLVSTVGLRLLRGPHQAGRLRRRGRNFPGQHGGIATSLLQSSPGRGVRVLSELPWSARWDCDFLILSLRCLVVLLDVGTSLVSTVGLRPHRTRWRTAPRSRASELPWSARWDCDVDPVGAEPDVVAESELPWSARWDCDEGPIRERLGFSPRFVGTSELPWSVRRDCGWMDLLKAQASTSVGTSLVSTVGLRPFLKDDVVDQKFQSRCRNCPGRYGGIATEDPASNGCSRTDRQNFPGQYGGIATSCSRSPPRR